MDNFNLFWNNELEVYITGIFVTNVANNKTPADRTVIRKQSRRLHDVMMWLLRGFTLSDPKKQYPGFYLSPQQSYVLTVIWEAENISPGEVARTLRLEKSHLTKIVNSLLDLNAVRKQTDEIDRRKQVLTLTEKGKRIYLELDKASIDSYEMLMSQVPESKRENVIKSTTLLLDAMNKLRECHEKEK